MGRTACTEPQYLYKGALYLNPFEGYITGRFLFSLSILRVDVIICYIKPKYSYAGYITTRHWRYFMNCCVKLL